jgi:hypothetical protein
MTDNDSSPGGIGTLAERSLHAALKRYVAQPGDRAEVKVDGSVIDLVRGDLLIEIQTRNFSAIRRKLEKLLVSHRVHLIHPVACDRWIVRTSADGSRPISRRKSPRRGCVEHIYNELVRMPHLAAHPNLTLEVLLVRDEEVRCDDGRGSWRRKRESIVDRRLLAVVERVVFRSAADHAARLPADLPDMFTVAELSAALGQPTSLAGKMAYTLRHMGVLALAGKRGSAYLYERAL